MRDENINRLTSTEVDLNSPYYLVYKSYHSVLFDCLKKYTKGKLLDIGCGNKPYQTIVSSLISEYIGCDIVQSSEKCVDIISPATNIPLPDESFDTIISTQTIEHVAEHQLLVNEAYRLLKPGCFFIVSGPMYWPLHEEPYDFFRFTKYGFRHVLEKAGFKVEVQLANGGKWALCGQTIIQTLYPDIYELKSLRWKLFKKFLSLIGGVKGINSFFNKMDEKYLDEKNTMNYVIVARKF